MRENTLNDDQTAAIVDANITILTQNPYMIIKGVLGERSVDIITVEQDNLLYPLFLMVTTELAASIKDKDTGEALFRLHRTN